VGKISVDKLLSTLEEIELLAGGGGTRRNIERASSLALTIAQNAPNGVVASAAMQVHDSCGLQRSTDSAIATALNRLRALLEDARRAGP